MQVKNITFVSIFFISCHYEPGKLFLTGATFFWPPPVIALFFECVPCQKPLPIFGTHSIGTVIRGGRNGSDVIFVFFLVEEVRKVSFGEFFDSKRFWKVGQFHRNEVERIDEFNVQHGNFQTQSLAATRNHLLLFYYYYNLIYTRSPVHIS